MDNKKVEEILEQIIKMKEMREKGEFVNTYEVFKLVNKFREKEGLRCKQLYHNFLQPIKTYEDHFINVGTKSIKMNIDNHNRNVYLLNKEGINLLISLITNSDSIPLQEIYEKLGGEERMISVIHRFEHEFIKDLSDSLEGLGLIIEREFYIGPHRVDGIIKTHNLVIEYDDTHHKYPAQIERDKIREIEIMDNGYEVIRVNYLETNALNIGYIIKKIIEIELKGKYIDRYIIK